MLPGVFRFIEFVFDIDPEFVFDIDPELVFDIEPEFVFDIELEFVPIEFVFDIEPPVVLAFVFAPEWAALVLAVLALFVAVSPPQAWSPTSAAARASPASAFVPRFVIFVPPPSVGKVAGILWAGAGRVCSKPYSVYTHGEMRILLAAVLLCALAATSVAATPNSGPREEFDALLARVRKSDPNVDFDRLRRLYVRLDTYTASSGTPKEMFEALDKNDFKAARSLAEAALAKNYLDLDAHMVAAAACKELGDAACSSHHEYVVDGLVGAIARSGDGTSRETAMFVISVAEEYTVARGLGYRVSSQRLDQTGGHSYDVFSVVDEAGKSAELYFDIDAIWAAEQRAFGR